MLDSVKHAVASVVTSIKSTLPAIVATTSSVALIGGSVYYYTIKDGIYEKSSANVRYVLEEYINQITVDSIVSNNKGGYAYSVNLDDTVDEIVDKLKEANSNIREYTGALKEKDIIEKLIRAEIISKYPDLRSEKEIKEDEKIRKNELQGGIKIISKDSSVDTTSSDNNKLEYKISNKDKILTYIPYENFKNKMEAKNDDIKNYFTLKSSGEENSSVDIIVAGWTKEKTTVNTIEYKPNEDNKEDTRVETQNVTNSNIDFYEININYQNMLSKYSMPAGFLWSLLVMGENVSFVENLADLAIENTNIIIEAHNNTVTTYNANVQKYRCKKEIEKKDDDGNVVKTTIVAKNESTKTTIVETQQSNTSLDLTFAETWVATYKNNYKNTVYSDAVYSDDWLNDAEWTTLENGIKSASYVQSYNTNLYTSAGTIVQERTDIDEDHNFVTYFNKSGRAKVNILQTTSWLYEMLESHEKTVDMVDLFKYLLYKATNKDYGVTSYNFEPYTNMASAYQSSLEQYIRFMHAWEGTPQSEGDYYLVFDDGFGNLTIGWGICIYSNSDGIYMHKEAFAAIGHDVTKLKIGDKVLKTDVDNIKMDVVQNNIKRVESITTGLDLTQYQKYALVDRMYQSGNINGFVDAYNQYWQKGEEKLGEDTSSEDYSHGVAKWFMGKSTGGVLNRMKAQWLVFKYGYYNRIDEYYSPQSYNSNFYYGISIYNADGSVSELGIQELENHLTKNVLHTTIHDDNYANQNGPFEKWWQAPINYLQKFQCTWWANGRASQFLELTGSKHKQYPTQTGHGGNYYNMNKNNGWFKYGSTPKANSLVSWKYGEYGHVAYVEAYDQVTGDIWVSHAGGGHSWHGIQKLTKASGYKYMSGITLNGFIYLDEPN